MQVAEHVAELKRTVHHARLIQRATGILLHLLQRLPLNKLHNQVRLARLLKKVAHVGQIRVAERHQQIGLATKILDRRNLLRGTKLCIAQLFDSDHAARLEALIGRLVDSPEATFSDHVHNPIATLQPFSARPSVTTAILTVTTRRRLIASNDAVLGTSYYTEWRGS